MGQFNAIEEALDDLRQGKIILVTDDPDRENEGDFICAAQFATTENINFMATHGKGLICMPMSAEYVEKLKIPQMVSTNTDNHETAFTVSIDHVSTSTGISAAERSVTALACVADDAKPDDFRRPGHMFPLLAKKNGVLERYDRQTNAVYSYTVTNFGIFQNLVSLYHNYGRTASAFYFFNSAYFFNYACEHRISPRFR